MEGLTYFSKLSEGGSIEVYCHSWKGIKYSTFVTKEEKYQHPKTFLIPEAFNAIILENISDFKAEYNESSDSINLRYNFMANNYILLVLKRDQVGESDISVTLSQLDSRLSTLEPFDVIHVAKYPAWRDFDEFIKLPGYKYIEASQNPMRYLKTDGIADAQGNIASDTYYLGKYKETELKYIYGVLSSAGYDPNRKMCYICGRDSLSELKLYESDEIPRSDWHTNETSIEDKELKRIADKYRELKEPNMLKHYFTQSVKMITYGETPITNNYLLAYISNYINGWVLLHHESFAMKDICLDVFVEDNKCTFILKAEKYRSFGRYVGHKGPRRYICTLGNIIINGFKLTC